MVPRLGREVSGMSSGAGCMIRAGCVIACRVRPLGGHVLVSVTASTIQSQWSWMGHERNRTRA